MFGKTNVFVDTRNLNHFINFNKVYDEFKKRKLAKTFIFRTSKIITSKSAPHLNSKMAMFHKRFAKTEFYLIQ